MSDHEIRHHQRELEADPTNQDLAYYYARMLIRNGKSPGDDSEAFVRAGIVPALTAQVLEYLPLEAWEAWLTKQDWELQPEGIDAEEILSYCTNCDPGHWEKLFHDTGYEIRIEDGVPKLYIVEWSGDESGDWHPVDERDCDIPEDPIQKMRKDFSKAQSWLDYYTDVINTGRDPLDQFYSEDASERVRAARRAAVDAQADVDRIRARLSL
jgi:hypothetical protein